MCKKSGIICAIRRKELMTLSTKKNIIHHTIEFHAPSLENEVGFLFTNVDAPTHIHDGFAEFSLITSGEWLHAFEGTTRHFQKNTLIYLGTNTVHSLTPCIPDSNHFTFFFKEDYLRETLEKFFPERMDILTTKYKETMLSPNVASFLLYEAHEMIGSRTSFRHEMEFQNYIHNLIYFMFFKGDIFSETSTKNKHAFTLRTYFDNYLFLDEPLVAIYQMFPLSPATLIKQFESETGQTIVQYRNDKRMEYASLLLKDYKMTIIDVANKVGISSPSHFAAEFKKKFGVSPKEFSKRHVI